MRKKQMSCKKWNFTFVKLTTFDTPMKRQCFLALCRHRIILFLGNYFVGANCMKQRQFICNKCNFTFVKLNTFDMHMNAKRYLALGRYRITGSMEPTTWMKSNSNAVNVTLHLKITHIKQTHEVTRILNTTSEKI